MNFLEKKRIHLAALFQVIFLLFIFFAAYTEASNTVRLNTYSKTLLCINPGSSIVVRETSEQFSPATSFVKDNGILAKTWLCIERIKILALTTNAALHVSNSVYNTFYVLTTIHAP